MKAQEGRQTDVKFQIRGIVPVVPTPFKSDQEIDWEGLRALIDFGTVCGACALCLPAYASEFYKLSEDERRWYECLSSKAVRFEG